MPNLRTAGLAGAMVISALVGGTLISAVAASTTPTASRRARRRGRPERIGRAETRASTARTSGRRSPRIWASARPR